MFKVIRKYPYSEEVGSAEVIENGFKVRIYNGNSLLVVKSKKFIDRFEVFEKKDEKIIKKVGVGKPMDYANNWIQLNLKNDHKVYINLGPEKFDIEEFEGVIAI